MADSNGKPAAGLDLTSRLYASSSLAAPLSSGPKLSASVTATGHKTGSTKQLVPKIMMASMAKDKDVTTETKEDKQRPLATLATSSSVGSITRLTNAPHLSSSASLGALPAPSILSRTSLPALIAAPGSNTPSDIPRGAFGVPGPAPSVKALLSSHSVASLGGAPRDKLAAGRVIDWGFYSGQYMSDSAAQLLEVGREASARIHERRRRDVASSGVLISMGTNSQVGEGAALLYNPRAAIAEAQAAALSVASELRETFVESLHLPVAGLESLAGGNFLYLKPRKVAGDRNVYDLYVVDHKDTDTADYFTISKQGITHRAYFTGVSLQFKDAESDFTDLAQYEREYRIFHASKKIPMFAKYRTWKSFYLWRQLMKSKKQSSASGVLASTLFLLNPTLRTALMRLRRLCFEVADWGLFAIDKSKTFHLEEFVSQQNVRRVQITSWLTEFSGDVRALIRGACDEVLDGFLTANDIRADHKMTFMERAALRNECVRLMKFIKLADFLVRDTLLGLALESTAALVGYLVPPPALLPPHVVRTDMPDGGSANKDHDSKPVAAASTVAANRSKKQQIAAPTFVVSAAFDAKTSTVEEHIQVPVEGGQDGEQQFEERVVHKTVIEPKLVFAPSLSTVRSQIKTLVYDAMVVISAPPRLLSHPDLTPYTQAASNDADEIIGGTNGGAKGDDVDLTEAVTNHAAYKKMTLEMVAGLESAFAAVEKFSSVFLPFADTYFSNEGAADNVAANYSGDTELRVFERAIAAYKSQISEFDKIPTSADIGIFRIDSLALKQRVMPSPARCLQAIRDLLPVLMTQLTAALIGEVRSMYNVLASNPMDVDPFVAKLEMLDKVLDALPLMRDRESHIRAMAQLMSDNSWPIADDLKAQFRMLRDALADLDSAAQKAEASQDEDIKKFARQVDSAIPVMKKSVLAIREKLDEAVVSSADSVPHRMVKILRDYGQRMEELKQQSQKLQYYQQVLKQPIQTYDTLDEVATDLQVKTKLWEAMAEWVNLTQNWREAIFQEIDVDDIGKQVQTYQKVAVRSERALPGNGAAGKLKSLVEDFRALLPVVSDLRNKALRPRHWAEIETIIAQSIDPEKSYSLGELLDMNVVEHQPDISMVATKAVSELGLEELLEKKVTTVWNQLEFTVNPYKDSKEVFILGSVEDITVALDESLVTINTILGSRHCGHIRAEVENYQKRLMLLSETLDEWLLCQKQWMYLEAILFADDIRRDLPEESKKFATVDRSWKGIMKRTYNHPKAIDAGTFKGLKDTLIRHNEILEQIQKSLENYLEKKRSTFPRFYFLSNDELLEILAQSRDPQAVQPHLRKCFDALTKLEFGKEPGSVDILAMLSPEGERVQLPKNLNARGNVEHWLRAVQDAMVISLRGLMKEGVADYARKPRKQWVLSHAGQVVATVAQIMWSYETELALKHPTDPLGEMQRWYDKNVQQLTELTELVRSDISKLERRIIVALVTTDVHARDIIEELRDAKVTNPGAFTWQQQLRYYWDDSKSDVLARQSNCLIFYGYEYQGATTRLVITPLTDRCWMTITGAFHLKLGAAPAGPAGTGKTESSKDLAKALAIQCIVFNCSEQIDYLMLGKLFAGLAQSGAWTCLDEFNRIDIEVLSVVAQQLQQLRQGLVQGLAVMPFEGRTIALKPHCVIITMNPGYAGRTELPDNLKVQFRPVAMMVPDYTLIAEISLFAEGFDDAKHLSRKMTRLYRLSSEQLSQQKHYDFGMRAVKSVLVMAGALKRANPTLPEEVVLIRAMRDSNVPKFLADDLPLFHAIVGDLFPGVTVPTSELGELQLAVDAELKRAGLQKVDAFVNKIMQVFETFNVRFGAVIVGPTGAGKTACYKVLASAMSALKAQGNKDEQFQTVHMQLLNPKCISMGELYGEFNELTQDWKDGLASSIIRGYSEDETMDRKWTIFDGPIDALWIENMNTVLDDNMMLCLANGERIKLKPSQRMLFEVQDLEAASPATVSRLGVVYMTPADLGWQPIVKSWLPREMDPRLPPQLHEHILQLFVSTVDEGLEFRRANCIEPITTTDIQTVISICRLLTAMMRTAGEKNKETGLTPGLAYGRPVDELQRVIDHMFAFAYIWSVGGSIASECYEKFDSFVRGHKHTVLGQMRYGPGTVYDSFPDISQPDMPWRRWADIVPAFNYDREQPYFAMVVPTLDTVRFSWLLSTQLSQLYPVFFTGVTGTGKTVIVQDLINKTSSADFKGIQVTPILINFSARTSSMDTQMTIEHKLEKKKKSQLGAPSGKRVVVFVDDVNMPSVETYGAQPPIELLRFLIDAGGVYDRQKLFWKEVVDTVLVAAAAPPGGGRAAITQRFTRHFHLLCVPVASDEVFKHIFGSILSGFLTTFVEDIKAVSGKAVAATIEVFDRIRESMKPTPARSHYTFNLRDVSKVFQGILMVGPKECQSADVFTRLWIHECMRVFHDRLIDEHDKGWFTQLMIELVGRYFGRTGTNWSHEELFEKKPILFVDFLRPSMDDGPGIYEEAQAMERVVGVLDDALEDYNLGNPAQMKLVFFRDAVEHVARIARILRQPRGNAMLVGVGGSGKQSVSRMACHLADMDCFTIEIRRGYGIVEFRDDLKKLMTRSGVEGRPIAFLFGDTQIVQEGFLEDISNILNTGEVPGLFAVDELTKIVEDLRPVAQSQGIPETRDNIYRMFVSRVRDNLHILLTMSPVGTSLRVRCRQFPSLINCCTIDWYTPWPHDALLSVAARFLAEEELIPKELRLSIADMCVDIHQSVAQFADKFYAELHRKVYTTPKSYLDLINLYLSVLNEKQKQLGDMRNTLFVGSKKLDETNGVVESLRAELTKLQPIIDLKAKEAAAMLIQVSADQEEADKIRLVVESDAAAVSIQRAEVAVVQADAQKDLDVALPALERAQESLKKLDKKDISEVKSFATPPAAVKTVMEAVCLLLGEKTDWETAKKVLSRSTFMEELLEYNRDNVAPAKLKALVKYVENPDMSVDAVSRVSSAAKTLCEWVHAVDIYSKVAKEVEPKKKRLEEMNAKLDHANSILKAKEDALQAVLDKVAMLKQKCDEVQNEKQRLADEAQLTQDRLERAAKLTTGLSDEGVRWKASVGNFDKQIHNLMGDVLLAAGCISYYGAFTGSYRQEMITSWLATCTTHGIPVSQDFSLMGTLGDPVQVRDWQIFGLPTDSVSSDSAVLVTRGKRWPLMIDPQEQAKKWIKNMENKNKLQLTRFTNNRWLQTLESCIRLGQPLLIEDVGESLDPALEPVLQRATFKQGGRLLIRLGDSDVDYNPDFRLYMTTKYPNPHYLPEVCIKVTIINFTVTMSGLVDQLLGAAVRKERPDVEKRKNDLVVSMAKDKKQLKELEDRILKKLRESQGNILDDSDLINTLAESKELSKAIEERLRESERTEKEINEMRDRYRSVSIRGSLLYFVIADLALIDPMYQYSLGYFVQLYNRCIDLAEKSEDLPTRLQNLIEYITFASYTNVCRGLFETHKLLFSFLICVQIMRNAGTIADTEWSLLLRGAGLVVNPLPNPMPDIITEVAWNFAAALEKLVEPMRGLCAHIASTSSSPSWRTWAASDEPHTLPLPDVWASRLNMMQKMLVLKVFREEKLLFATKEFVTQNLGKPYVESPPVSLADVFKDSREDTPIIFILSVGADPTGLLQSYAKQMNYTSRLRLISLGQGQGPRAQQLIENASNSGDWVLLQNCHLARSWMPQLEKIVEAFGERKAGQSSDAPINPDFRLFLTSMPADYFPVPVLQNGVKLTNEPPKGIRSNLSRSLAQVDGWSSFESCEGAFEDGTPKINVWKKMSFGLCFFHAVVQERRKFGPLGFNIRYEINDSDLETSIIVLKMLLSEQPEIPWDALRYVTGQINYGGRVTDDWDRRCLMAILGRYYDPKILQDGYQFSPSGLYFAPSVGPLESYREYANQLPLNDPPEIFGMHNNANIANQQAETDVMIRTALSLQPRASGNAAGKSPDQIVAELAAEIEKALPAKLRMDEAGATTFQLKGEHMDSLATVLSQEMARFNKLLGVMGTSLADLQRAIRGEVLMSEELDKMYTALLNNQVPANWEAAAYPSLKPLASWVKDLHLRLAFMRLWLKTGQPNAFWLSGLFFPQGFLTGVLQNHARKYHVAIDTLTFAFKTLDQDGPDSINAEDVPEDGVLVYGMFMDGARWNKEKRMIDDSKPGEIYSPWPVVHMIPTKDYKTSPTEYSAPVYKTSTRAGVLSTTGISSSFVIAVDVPTDRQPEHWIYCGAALVLQLNV